MLSPAISVIIPTYNRADYLAQCVESVLAQTFADYEVIVVDDGSTDDTKAVLAPFTGAPQFHYYYQPNGGRSAARNHGSAKARGNYLVFLDSDDMLFPDAFAKLYRLAEQTGAGLVVGQVQYVDEHLQEVRLLEPNVEASKRGLSYPALIWGRYFLMQGSFLLRRYCLDEVGPFERELEPCEDFDFCLRVALRYELACLDSPVLRCRLHGGNTDLTNILQGGLKVARKHLRLVEAANFPAELRRQSKTSWLLRMADNFYGLGDNPAALRHYLRAMWLEPVRALDLRTQRQLWACLVPVALRRKLKPAPQLNKRMNSA